MALPKKIYVYEQTDNDGSKYLIACRDPKEMDEDGRMGEYELKQTVRVTHKVEVTPS